MKILLVGASGMIGQAIAHELGPRHELITAGSKSGEVQVDITSSESIEAMYKKIGAVDAVIAAAGHVHFGPLTEMTEVQFLTGVHSKLMGQVNLVLLGQNYINKAGSFTLTTGVLSEDPIYMGANASAMNGAVNGFVKGAAVELSSRGLRINAVSPTLLLESMPQFEAFFPGVVPVPAAIVARAYAKSVEGMQTGQVYRVGY